MSVVTEHSYQIPRNVLLNFHCIFSLVFAINFPEKYGLKVHQAGIKGLLGKELQRRGEGGGTHLLLDLKSFDH